LLAILLALFVPTARVAPAVVKVAIPAFTPLGVAFSERQQRGITGEKSRALARLRGIACVRGRGDHHRMPTTAGYAPNFHPDRIFQIELCVD
jgi:hypothetical protein